MANVMDGIRKMEKEELCSQLASLKTVTMTNIVSEMGQKTSSKAVKAFNGMRKLFHVAPVKEPAVVPLNDRIENCKAELNSKSKDELIEEMRSVLIQKIRDAGDVSNGELSDDGLSVYVIETGCKNFKNQINEHLTYAQKADAIYQRYNERLIAQTREKYNKASEEEKRKITAEMQRDFDAMPAEKKEELRRALGVEKVTGEALAKLISTSAGASALLIALNASGFGAFMALTTIMHAVFTTTLGITLPFAAYTTSTSILSFFLGPAGWIIFFGAEFFMLHRNRNKLIYELLSQIVWASVLACGGQLSPKEESLPSWLPKEQREKAILENQKFMVLQREFDELKTRYNSQNEEILRNGENQKKTESEIRNLQNKIRTQESHIIALEKEKDDCETKLNNAKTESEKYKEFADSENELLRQKYKEAQAKMNQAEDDMEKKSNEILELRKSNEESQELVGLYYEDLKKAKQEKEKLQDENDRIKLEVEKTKEKLDHEELKKSKELQQRWEKAYKKFQFANGVIKHVVKSYERAEYGDIESCLVQIHGAQDPAALASNRGKMANSGELHFEFSTYTGFPSRVFCKILRNVAGKTVEITDIKKHNDSRYGKT